MYDTIIEFIMTIWKHDNRTNEKMNNNNLSKQDRLSYSCRQTNRYIILYAVVMMAFR